MNRKRTFVHQKGKIDKRKIDSYSVAERKFHYTCVNGAHTYECFIHILRIRANAHENDQNIANVYGIRRYI